MAETLGTAITTDLTYNSASWRILDAKDDTANTNEDSPVKIDVLANDVGALGIIKVGGKSVTADTPPVPLESGATVDLDGKTLIYDPGMAFQSLNSGENKSDTFSYTVAGYRGREDIANVAVTIEGVDEPGPNHAPVAYDDKADFVYYEPLDVEFVVIDAPDSDYSVTTFAIGEEGDPDPYPSGVKINVLANDKDADGDPLKVAMIAGNKAYDGHTVTLESGAGVTLHRDGSLIYSAFLGDARSIDIIELADGSFEGVFDPIIPPPPDSDSFTYTATDDKGAESNAATVTVYRQYILLGAEPEPVADASAAVAFNEPSDLLLT